MAILAGLPLDFVGDEFDSVFASLPVLSLDPIKDDLHATGDPLELGLDSSLTDAMGLTTTGGGGALAFTLVPVSL